jgi:hypothetical protein
MTGAKEREPLIKGQGSPVILSDAKDLMQVCSDSGFSGNSQHVPVTTSGT